MTFDAGDAAPGRARSVQTRHRDIHDDDVRLMEGRLLARLEPIRGLRHNVQLRIARQDRAQSLADDGVVIHNQHTESGHRVVHEAQSQCHGQRSRMRQPPNGADHESGQTLSARRRRDTILTLIEGNDTAGLLELR